MLTSVFLSQNSKMSVRKSSEPGRSKRTKRSRMGRHHPNSLPLLQRKQRLDRSKYQPL
ncbi:uncharacterized protein RCC_08480 [Ramularia collo-cygni]|uniref:Uncharacterized protein n=1 Tax=Ramularia collo-cygni TaxID=112498 RepID=A0A2D3V087_9PEZI|nr:uncharacterized protein RCC_08480 [Ramularia collo-cygni]CZT22776.1 uncharacterized protein RCC_08480 [Ramularia collo-cygni]